MENGNANEVVKIMSAAIGLSGSVKPEKQAQAAYDALIAEGFKIERVEQ